MTREEAIYLLKNAAWLGTNKDREQTEKAVEMAISALEQPCDTCIHNDEEWDSDHCDSCCGNHSGYEPITTSTDEPMTMVYPTILCDDAISREAAINIASIHTLTVNESVEALKRLPSVQPKPIECKDAISRNDMLDAVGHGTTYTTEHLQKIINGLPSVQPSRNKESAIDYLHEIGWMQDHDRQMMEMGEPSRKGHWIDREEYDADRWKCSECGRTELWKEKFCPSCGADMRGVE